MQGFTYSLPEHDITENEKKILSFALTSTMQAAFLRQKDSKELLGYDLKIKEERDSFINNLVTILCGGARHE